MSILLQTRNKSGHFQAAQNLPQNPPLLMECPLLYKILTKTGHYRARLGDCPKSPRYWRVAPKKIAYSGEQGLILDQWFQIGQKGPVIIAQFVHELRILQSCRFRVSMKTIRPSDPGFSIFEFIWNFFKCFQLIQINRKVVRDLNRLQVFCSASVLHIFGFTFGTLSKLSHVLNISKSRDPSKIGLGDLSLSIEMAFYFKCFPVFAVFFTNFQKRLPRWSFEWVGGGECFPKS